MSDIELKPQIDPIPDTAYLAALYRAYESESADAKFRDPYAALLAAPRAEALEKKTAVFREEGRWFMTVRTCLLDEHITRLVADGVDTVLNLGAGLDTRPYRLALPKNLQWIEADRPGITQYKMEKLKATKPRCQLHRIALDFTDADSRAVLFEQLEQNSRRTLVLTEGLLPYLPETTVAELAQELRDSRTVSHWLMDLTTVSFLERIRNRWKQHEAATVDSAEAVQFVPTGGAKYFARHGWRAAAFDSFLDGGDQIGRKAPATLSTIAEAAIAAEDSGVLLLQRG